MLVEDDIPMVDVAAVSTVGVRLQFKCGNIGCLGIKLLQSSSSAAATTTTLAAGAGTAAAMFFFLLLLLVLLLLLLPMLLCSTAPTLVFFRCLECKWKDVLIACGGERRRKRNDNDDDQNELSNKQNYPMGDKNLDWMDGCESIEKKILDSTLLCSCSQKQNRTNKQTNRIVLLLL
mmetsp:Transcript_10532/g.25124  ORF Transcript_10532/g.25124 Transcript_10532/m.25124 type:complete len:176 (-) Transcript_10532:62-589(-)